MMAPVRLDLEIVTAILRAKASPHVKPQFADTLLRALWDKRPPGESKRRASSERL